jgi:hypothetical protein
LTIFESEGMVSMFPVKPLPDRERRRRFSFNSDQRQEGMVPSMTLLIATVVHGMVMVPGHADAAPRPSNESTMSEVAEQRDEGSVP